MPSSKDSKDESTPKSEQKTRVKELTIETINKPSEPTHIVRPATPIKREEIYPKLPEAALSNPPPPFISPHIPAQVPTHQPTTRTHKASTSAQATTNPKPLPTLPASQALIMSTIPYRMPIHGTDRAPKFNGKTAQLRDFLETYDQHADDVNLQGLDCIMQLL
ncbi:hypothetical protein CY34DRAFT_17737 [Suillus luteus UH-Slu-Lm8-n1]|uniref:Uncharacterized protein n=1 Tax=Suillus luteus UH-Slu-Lm8-n1 TaxID=930992 RepID=A0A0D0AR14_9AGAM|nr:hypothetical protein CY34DRAFT_17737 [Suillus luteus UH-Slu-Lm8-n1]